MYICIIEIEHNWFSQNLALLRKVRTSFLKNNPRNKKEVYFKMSFFTRFMIHSSLLTSCVVSKDVLVILSWLWPPYAIIMKHSKGSTLPKISFHLILLLNPASLHY